MNMRIGHHRLGGIRSCFILVPAVLTAGGCYQPISIQPSCPAELTVGETGRLLSNVKNAGQSASFQWDVTPTDIGQISQPTTADPDFTALKPGTATLKLTASDGLFQVISQCETVITAP